MSVIDEHENDEMTTMKWRRIHIDAFIAILKVVIATFIAWSLISYQQFP